MPRIFISYRRDDSADIVGRIYDHLVARLGGDTVFKDVDSIPLGADFRATIGNAIAKCEVLLAVIGPDWLDSPSGDSRRRIDNADDFVRVELEDAFARGLRIIPLLVRGAAMPASDALPHSLKNLSYLNAISIRADPDFVTDISRLTDVLPGVSDSVHTRGKDRQLQANVGTKAVLGSRTVGCSMTIAIATSLCMMLMISGRWALNHTTQQVWSVIVHRPIDHPPPPAKSSPLVWIIVSLSLGLIALVIWYIFKKRRDITKA